MRMIPEKESTRVTLRAGGLRTTGPRRLILETARATDAHPTAAWVHERVRKRLPSVSLATVYRNLLVVDHPNERARARLPDETKTALADEL